MASCEKCWAESRGNYDLYQNLIASRKCTPEEQAGKRALVCAVCKRKTVHQLLMKCTVCGRSEILRDKKQEQRHEQLENK